MKNSEFDLIKKYFTFSNSREDVVLAGGDDCAILAPPENRQLLITTDTLISGVHFPENTSAEDIAYKAVMVNLSDLAAMGATPAWLTLAISLPEINENWLQAFSQQLSELLGKYNLSLIGGDTTKGPLSITIQAMGFATEENIMRRDAAKAGDAIFVSGYLGDAAIGLKAVLQKLDDEALLPCIDRLNRPQAKILFAQELGQYVNCAIDISDGLVADLGHIAEASHCGARIRLSDIPVSPCARFYFKQYPAAGQSNNIDWSIVVTQGDDYELCFTVSESQRDKVLALAEKYQTKLSCIGEITNNGKIEFIDENEKAVTFSSVGFNHFDN